MDRKSYEVELGWIIHDLTQLESLPRDLVGPYQRARMKELQDQYKATFTEYEKKFLTKK